MAEFNAFDINRVFELVDQHERLRSTVGQSGLSARGSGDSSLDLAFDSDAGSTENPTLILQPAAPYSLVADAGRAMGDP